MAKVGLKSEITFLVEEKGLKDFYDTIHVHLVGMHYLKFLPKGVCMRESW